MIGGNEAIELINDLRQVPVRTWLVVIFDVEAFNYTS